MGVLPVQTSEVKPKYSNPPWVYFVVLFCGAWGEGVNHTMIRLKNFEGCQTGIEPASSGSIKYDALPIMPQKLSFPNYIIYNSDF